MITKEGVPVKIIRIYLYHQKDNPEVLGSRRSGEKVIYVFNRWVGRIEEQPFNKKRWTSITSIRKPIQGAL
jgi:hypothetical protein